MSISISSAAPVSIRRRSLAVRLAELRHDPISIVAFVAVLARMPLLAFPVSDHHLWRQSQTAMAIEEFGRSGISMLRPVVPIFGRRSVVVYEFPLYQALAALLRPLGIGAESAGRVLSIASLGVLTLLVGRLGTRWWSSTVGVVAAVAIAFSPFAVAWGASVMIEYFVLVFIMGALLALERWRTGSGNRWLALASVLLLVGSLVKFTTVLLWLTVVAAVVLGVPVVRRRSLFVPALLTVVGPGVAGAGWTLWADHVKSLDPLTAPLTGQGMLADSLGAMHRLGHVLAMPLTTVAVSHLALIGLIPLMVGVVSGLRRTGLAPRRLIVAALLLVPVAGIAVFPVQYEIHDYYTAAWTPALALLVGLGAAALRRFLAGRSVLPVGVASAILAVPTFVVPAGWVLGLSVGQNLPLRAVAAEIRSATTPGSVVGVVGKDWDPSVLYLADRPGVMASGDLDAAMRRWKSERASTAAFLSWDMSRLHRIASSFVLTPRSPHVVGLDGLDGSLATRPVVGYPAGRAPVSAPSAGGRSVDVRCDSTSRPVGVKGAVRIDVPTGSRTLVSVNSLAGVASSTIDVRGDLLHEPVSLQCFGGAVDLRVTPLA